MKIYITPNYDVMSKAAARIIADLVNNKANAVLGLATGGTPIGTYQELIRMHEQENLDFSQIVTFNLDEYLGIGLEPEKNYHQDQSYGRFMYEELFKHINISPEKCHIPDGKTENPEKHCLEYEGSIKKAGGIDLQLLGIGGDGHLAFNEPGSSLYSRTRIVDLHARTIEDNWHSFFKNSGFVKTDMPRQALTMGVGTILESRHAVMLASGKQKAEIIARALEGPVTSQVTATALQLHPGKVTVILDKEAASELVNRQICYEIDDIDS